VGKQKFKSDLIPSSLLIARYLAPEQSTIDVLEGKLTSLEQQLDDLREEQGGEGGLLEEVVDEKGKIAKRAIAARLMEIGYDEEFAEERKALEDYAALLDRHANAKGQLKAAQEALEAKVAAKYGELSEADVKRLVVDDKWLAQLSAGVQGEMDRVSQALTARIRQLAERYAAPLPQLTAEVEALSARVEEHLRRMGAVV